MCSGAGDIRSPEDVRALTRGAAGVFHCASFGMSGKEMLRDSLIRAVNVDGTLLLLDACGENKVKVCVSFKGMVKVCPGHKDKIDSFWRVLMASPRV